MGTKGTCVLVVNDDLTCNNIVHEMLQHCNHEVLRSGGVLDVLNAIWERKDSLDLVLTNAHKLEANGIEVIQHIQKKLNLPIILMSPDKMQITPKGEPFSFAAYVLNGLNRSDVNNLWQSALEKERNKVMATHQQEASMGHIVAKTNKTYSSTCDAIRFNHKRKREKTEKSDQDNKEDPPVAKKPRVVWTMEMHQKFLEAIEIIGYDKAVPKKIVEVMGIPGLTRENVASHLQKFRGSIKRIQETTSGNSTTKVSDRISVLPSPFASRFSFLHSNITHLQQSSYTSTARHLFSTKQTDALQQRHVPNYRTYGDQMRNMLLRTRKHSPSRDHNDSYTGKFVGYRLTNDGNSIQFGKPEDEISRRSLISSSGTSENQYVTLFSRHSPPVQPKCSSLVDQYTSMQSTEAFADDIPSRDLFENDVMDQNATIYQDYLMPSLGDPGNDLLVQNSGAFSEGISEQHCSSPSLPEMLQNLDDFFDLGGIETERTTSPSDKEECGHKHDD